MCVERCTRVLSPLNIVSSSDISNCGPMIDAAADVASPTGLSMHLRTLSVAATGAPGTPNFEDLLRLATPVGPSCCPPLAPCAQSDSASSWRTVRCGLISPDESMSSARPRLLSPNADRPVSSDTGGAIQAQPGGWLVDLVEWASRSATTAQSSNAGEDGTVQ